MKALNQQKTELFRNILFITLGSLLYALNFDLFLEPGGISSGGVSGIAMIIVYAAHPKFLTVGILNACSPASCRSRPSSRSWRPCSAACSWA